MPQSHAVVVGKIDTLTPEQNVRQFAQDIFKIIFLNQIFFNYDSNSMKFVSAGENWQEFSFGSGVAWYWIGDEPLTDLMIIKFNNVEWGQ